MIKLTLKHKIIKEILMSGTVLKWVRVIRVSIIKRVFHHSTGVIPFFSSNASCFNVVPFKKSRAKRAFHIVTNK